MLKALKINIAAFICLAFIFRLLFINIGIVSSLNTHQNKASVKHHFSSATKSRRYVDSASNPISMGYSSVAIVEEDFDDDEQFKLNSLSLPHVFYSNIETKIECTLKKITSFNKYFSFNSSHRYLEYQVFRI